MKNDATKVELIEAYKKHIVKHHPDNYPGASDIIKTIQHAYEVLTNDKTRSIYDLFCTHILYGPQEDGAEKTHALAYPKPSWVVQKNDIVYIADMSLRNIYMGKKSTVSTKDMTIEVDIKKGTKDGERITYKGMGCQQRTGPPGDLVIIINRIEYPLFQQRNCNIHCSIDIDQTVASKGGELCIRHPSGNIICLELKPGEIRGPGMQKIFKKMGHPLVGKKDKGDMQVKFNLYFPYADISI
ncbi:Type I HSP40 co-chaperone [Kickxella alabastrina]|nr:Type I HSP40 co-chaperone [Kickxella alabastrina]